MTEIRPEIRKDNKSVRSFSIALAVLLSGFGALSFYKGHPETATVLWSIAGGVLLLGLPVPKLIMPVYIGWMHIAHAIGWFNTRLLLTILFYLILTPIALVMKVLMKDQLDRKFDGQAETYWKPHRKRENPTASYERQF